MTFKKCEKITVKVNSTKEKINTHSFDKDENIKIMSNSYNNVQEKRWDLNFVSEVFTLQWYCTLNFQSWTGDITVTRGGIKINLNFSQRCTQIHFTQNRISFQKQCFIFVRSNNA